MRGWATTATPTAGVATAKSKVVKMGNRLAIRWVALKAYACGQVWIHLERLTDNSSCLLRLRVLRLHRLRAWVVVWGHGPRHGCVGRRGIRNLIVIRHFGLAFN